MKWQPMRSGKKSKLVSIAIATLAVGASALAVGALGPAVQSPAGGAGTARDRGFEGFWGPLYRAGSLADFDRVIEAARRQPADTLGRVKKWNRIAIDASGLDHTPVAPGENRIFGEQRGPGRATRALAIVHIAMFDALNAVVGGYRSYGPGITAPAGTSADAAIAQAAHDTLAALFTSQKATFDAALAADLASLGPRGKAAGVAVGQQAAAAILARRANDGAGHSEPSMDDFHPSDAAGKWRMDPISQIPVALGARWGEVQMFSPLRVASRFRVAPPPPMESEEYAAAFNEVKRLGGDGVHTLTERTQQQTYIGIYWAYDGTPSLCAPPRLYNQITVAIAEKMGSNAIELARLLALVNVSMADAATAIWESKYYYQLWRPVTGIREADAGTGPTGDGDGNDATEGDVLFSPLGAPASNLEGPNFTPPFPAYPSGHAGMGGALFQTLRRFYRTDQIAFTFVSDELNGITKDNEGVARPRIPRSFRNLSDAEEENGQSRIYLGIHWAFDKEDGIQQGRAVADHVFRKLFLPLPRRAEE
jgi:hypothetical protein